MNASKATTFRSIDSQPWVEDPPSDIDFTTPSDTHKAGVERKTTSTADAHTVNQPAFAYNASVYSADTNPNLLGDSTAATQTQSSPNTVLRVRTDFVRSLSSQQFATTINSEQSMPAPGTHPQQESTATRLRKTSLSSALSPSQYTANSLSPGSAYSSPGLGPLADITPLPSPITLGESPGPWRHMANNQNSDEHVSGQKMATPPGSSYLETVAFARTSPKRSGPYLALGVNTNESHRDEDHLKSINLVNHGRNRSLSEYVPEAIQVPRRNIAVSGYHSPASAGAKPPPATNQLHREQYLAVKRGLDVPTTTSLALPEAAYGESTKDLNDQPPTSTTPEGPIPSVYEATLVRHGVVRRWWAIRELGNGTFSRVMLATSEDVAASTSGNAGQETNLPTIREEQVSPKSLVAVKICEHGPAGGADEQKIEISLKRELEILKSVHHPSLVHLKAVNVLKKRAFLVLTYCPGGDLFELASSKLDLLVHGLIQRIFSELVAAARYLHEQYIVHRDIKLENVLVNISTFRLPSITDWQTYPLPVVTLTDFGLGRWIPKPPDSPLLDTRCGSEDYAAPELLMGQEYDGRATDAWALGVLLYALMEGRLPFDPIPGARRQSPTSHRIARCEWSWVKWADSEGEWDVVNGKDLEGARHVVEGLLIRPRSRWPLEKVGASSWVANGITVPGGLQLNEDDEDDGQ